MTKEDFAKQMSITLGVTLRKRFEINPKKEEKDDGSR